MYKNFKKIYSGELWENLVWGAARAYKKQELTRILGIINKNDPKALDWLDREPRSSWARAHFDWISKCDELTNNFSESFNNWILKIRDKPFVRFIDRYNLDLLNLVYERRELSMELVEGDVVPNVYFMIKKRELRHHWYEIKGVSDTEYLAINNKSGKRYNVDLGKFECSCIEWQMSGIPCAHAVAVIRKKRVEKWSSPYFSVEAFRELMQTIFIHLENIEDWEEIDDPEELVLPPEVASKVGRPRKQRIRGDDEPPKTRRKCTKCGELGHNSITCDQRQKGIYGKKKRKGVPGQEEPTEAPKLCKKPEIKKPQCKERSQGSRTNQARSRQQQQIIKKPQSGKIKKPQSQRRRSRSPHREQRSKDQGPTEEDHRREVKVLCLFLMVQALIRLSEFLCNAHPICSLYYHGHRMFKFSRRVHKEILLLERWVEGVAGQVSVVVEGECEGVELFGFEDANDFLE
ncbi:hypothetical protein IFM89_008775 [Coptis chinensis]|uniref:SWIM-type domain-containing protein n=1 Tax=Coptis chinensis TaxID=261450 RepID=A0A835GXJ8_9MAGN|nr:hypothetical protein IFM89_008775 [Coptis chinensis]